MAGRSFSWVEIPINNYIKIMLVFGLIKNISGCSRRLVPQRVLLSACRVHSDLLTMAGGVSSWFWM